MEEPDRCQWSRQSGLKGKSHSSTHVHDITWVGLQVVTHLYLEITRMTGWSLENETDPDNFLSSVYHDCYRSNNNHYKAFSRLLINSLLFISASKVSMWISVAPGNIYIGSYNLSSSLTYLNLGTPQTRERTLKPRYVNGQIKVGGGIMHVWTEV